MRSLKPILFLAASLACVLAIWAFLDVMSVLVGTP